MRLISVTFLLVSIFAPSSAYADNSIPADLAKYQSCLAGLEKSATRYRGIIPSIVLIQDRKLVYMFMGIGEIRSNFELLTREFGTAAVDMPQRHLVSNAAQGCEDYRAIFENRAQKLLLFSLFAGATALLLTLHLFLNIVATGRRNAVVSSGSDAGSGRKERSRSGAQEDRPPSDKKGGGSFTPSSSSR